MIYILGSSGFIGQNLVRLMVLKKIKFKIIKKDKKKNYLMPKKIEDNDICINLASITGFECEKNKNISKLININLNKEILNNFKKIVFTSTSSVYGDQDKYCDEKSSIYITNYYTETKMQAEEILRKSDETLILRLATCFTIKEIDKKNNLIHQAMYDLKRRRKTKIFSPNNFRPYIEINDLNQIILTLIKQKNTGTFNVGSKKLNLTKRDVINTIRSNFPKYMYEIDHGSHDSRNYRLSYNKLLSHLKFDFLTFDKIIKNYM